MRITPSRFLTLGSLLTAIVTTALVTMFVATQFDGASAAGKSGRSELVFEWYGTFSTASSGNLAIGEHKYFQADLVAVGDGPSGTPVGVWKDFEVATGPVGVFGGMGYGVVKLDGRGEIYLRSVFGESEFGVSYGSEGAIVGGTGEFAGVNGTWSQTPSSEDRLFELVFEMPISSFASN